MTDTECRTIDTMEELLACAKLDESSSVGPVQYVHFATDLLSDQYKIFELPASLVEHFLKPGVHKVVELKSESKPNEEGRVFACTDLQTYSLNEAETSNTLLLTSQWWIPSKSSKAKERTAMKTCVEAIKSTYFELQPCIAPSLFQLRQTLLPSAYNGPVEDSLDSENSEKHETEQYLSREDLIHRFPCSAFEISRAFTRLWVCELGGRMRLMEPDYLNQVIRDIFAWSDENAWDWRNKGFPRKAVIDYLAQTHHDLNLVDQILSLFFAQRSSQTFRCNSSEPSCLFPINSKICQLVGEHLLSVTNSFDLTDFLAIWKATVPDGLRPELRRHLTCNGRAYCQSLSSIDDPRRTDTISFSGRRCISLLRSEDLPDESVEARLTALFKRCPAWPEAELASYITELVLAPDTSGTNSSNQSLFSIVLPDTDPEFQYALLSAEDDQNDFRSDTPDPIPSSVGTILGRFCRVSNCSSGRLYTEKHTGN